MFVEELLPIYDIHDSVAVVVHAGPDETWEALMGLDLMQLGKEKPLVGVLGGLRMVPAIASNLLHGKRPPAPPKQLRLRDTTAAAPQDGGWLLLGEAPGEAIALGLVGKFWLPVIRFRDIPPEDFGAFDEPGWAKTIYELTLHALGDGRTQLEGVMRTATTDEHARRMFRRYWTLGVGSGAHVLCSGMLEQARERAERAVPV